MPVRRVRGSPFADIDAYLAQQGLLSAATGTDEVGKVQVPIFSQNHRQSRVVPRASPRQGRSRKSHAASRPVASPQVAGGAIIETNATGSRQSPFANPWDLDESHGACASGPSRVMASNGCPALEDAKDGKASAASAASVGSVEDLFDPSARLGMGERAPATRSKHFPNSQMSQPETAKKPKLDLSSLSAEQREAISEPLNRPLLILAGPGSGKTHFLVTRIRQALSESVPAEGIIAVTYTRKAADELSHRVKQHAGPGAKVWVSTVHGLALRFLREAGGRSGAPCKAASEEDRRAAAGVVLGQPQLQELFSYLEALPDSEGNAGDAAQASKKHGQAVAKLLSVFDQKGRWLANSVQDVSQQPLLVTAHQAFLQELRKQRLLDISEVIEAASRLQQADAESSSRWVASFAQMLFVDEWQDIDTEQQDFLARLLGQGHITAVGDDDQRIYAWRDRGASAPEAFRKHWSSACIKTLGVNHRALPHLVEAATRLISHNSHREKKELRSARQDAEQSGRVSVVAKECLNAEARWVAEEIQRGGDAKSFGPCAILTRTNASATVFAKALSQLGLPVWPSARKGVTDGPRTSQVLDLLAYLRLVVDPHHDPSFLRICNVPRRGVGKAALRCLREQFGAPAETSLSTFQGVEDLNVEQAALRARSLAGGVDGEPASGSFEGAMGRLLKAPWLGSNMRLAQGLATLATVLRAARRAAAAEHGAADVLRVILAETGLGSGSGSATGAAKATGSGRKSESTEASASPASLGLQQLMAAAEKYADGQNGAACVVRFLQEMAPRGARHAASTSSKSSVFVSTIHQAKGLEWDTVFLVQCNEMVMPLQRQGMQMADEQLEEERRLFYVAMTRARNRLVLSFSLKRDSGEAAEPSRFLFETGAMDSDTTDPMHTLDLGDGDRSVGIGTNPEEPPLKSRKTNDFFQTGLEVQRLVKETQVLPWDTDRAPSGMQSWIPKALESEQALCASFFGTDCLQK